MESTAAVRLPLLTDFHYKFDAISPKPSTGPHKPLIDQVRGEIDLAFVADPVEDEAIASPFRSLSETLVIVSSLSLRWNDASTCRIHAPVCLSACAGSAKIYKHQARH